MKEKSGEVGHDFIEEETITKVREDSGDEGSKLFEEEIADAKGSRGGLSLHIFDGVKNFNFKI